MVDECAVIGGRPGISLVGREVFQCAFIRAGRSQAELAYEGSGKV
jgi:hypothetical protein